MTFATYAALEFNEIKVAKFSEFTIIHNAKHEKSLLLQVHTKFNMICELLPTFILIKISRGTRGFSFICNL